MGDTVEIPWALSNTQLNPVVTGQQGALAGLDIGQKRATVHALQGVDVTNPGSLDTSLNSLIHAGASDQANALLTLGATRSAFGQILPALAKLNNLGTQTSDAQPAEPDTDHMRETMSMASDAVSQLLQTAPDRRAEVAARMKEDFTNRGVPPQAIDSVISDLSDAHLASLKESFDAHGAHMGATLSPTEGAPASVAPGLHPTTPSWVAAMNDDPGLLSALGFLKSKFGIDTGLPERAQAFALPAISAEAQTAQAGPTRLAQNAADLLTNPTRLTQEATGAAQKSLQEKLVAAGLDPVIAGRVAAAQEAAGAPYHPVTVPTATGAPAVESGAEFAAQHGGPAVAQGATSIGPQVGPSPGQTAVNVASSNQFANDRVLASNAQAQMVPLRKVYDLLPTTNTGPGTQVTNTWRSFVISQIPALHSLYPGGLTAAQIATANTDELKKYMTQIAGAQAAQYGQGTNEKLAIAASGNANPDLSNLANRDVTRMNIALLRAQQAKVAMFGNQPPEGYANFAANFARTVDPRAFMLDILSPAERGKVLGTIRTPSEKAAFLAGKRAAEQSGIFAESDIPR